jgi:endoglucanase
MLNNHVIAARACDDRIGIWMAAEALRIASRRRLNCAICAVSSVQEETGCHGAKMVARNENPDLALVLEVTHATDVPGLDHKRLGCVKMGEGPTVSVGRENHHALVKRLRGVAGKHKLPLQVQAFSMVGGTNAQSYWIANGGIPSVVVSVPDRYMHSTVEMVDLNDLNNAARLVAAFCADLKKGEQFKVEI